MESAQWIFEVVFKKITNNLHKFIARILTYVIKNNSVEHQILVSSADGVADIKLLADNGRFSGDLKLRKLNVRLHRSGIDGVDSESISQIAPLAKTFLGPQLARGLKQGFPYPLKVNFYK